MGGDIKKITVYPNKSEKSLSESEACGGTYTCLAELF